ncbi:MAG: hypothetical protein OER88_00210 [Planctomycetota bacterium]|nr:hypothetical protein [Planctomycetota bacterium]
MSRLRLLLPVLLLLVTACDKKRKPVVAETPQPDTNIQQPKPPAPAPRGVPPALKTMLDNKWPQIEVEGKAFLVKFGEAQKLREDRPALSKKIEEARQHYNKAKDMWAEVAYWPTNELDDGNIDQKTYDMCERYLRTKSKVIIGWDKKAKSIKELSTVR